MKNTWSLLGIMVLGIMAGCAATTVADAPPAELVISQSWSGDYPVAELKRLPEGQIQSRLPRQRRGIQGSMGRFQAGRERA
jgi:hypothetical protein